MDTRDYAKEIQDVNKVIAQEKESYKQLEKYRKDLEETQRLQRLKNIGKISEAELKVLSELTEKSKEYNEIRLAEEKRLADLKLGLIRKQQELEQTQIRTAEEFRIAVEQDLLQQRIANEQNLWTEKIKLENIGNKFVIDGLHQHQQEKLLAEQELQTKINLLRLQGTDEERKEFEDLYNEKLAREKELSDAEKALKASFVQNDIDKQEFDIKMEMLQKLREASDEQYNEQISQTKRGAALQEQLDKKRQKQLQENAKRSENAELQAEYKKLKEIQKAEKKQESEKRKKQTQHHKDQFNAIFGANTDDDPKTFKDRIEAIKDIGKNPNTGMFDMKAAIVQANALLMNLAEMLEKKIDEVAAVQSGVDTRLQGSQQDKSGINGSYWNAINKDFTKYAGVTPFFKRETLTANLQSMVQKGISYHVAQRAFLMTVSDKIATTFEATNGTLLRLVRIQQQDSTAARLGMESSLTAFLNNMYETTEYMGSIANQVKSNLEEAMSLINYKDAVSLEHTIQKWLGSMYSVGMSESSVQSLAGAIGNIAAGKIDNLTGEGAGNLVVMAANQAGISIADVLAEGMSDDVANELLASAVEYLAGLYNDNKDNKVVQQQIAKVFGVAASDLKAAANLAKKDAVLDTIYKVRTEYTTNMDRLLEMAGSMALRTSMGEMMTNMWSNLQYSIASGMANNPVLYGMYKIGKLMGDLGADINLPFLNVYGFGVDLNATVSELMRGGAMAGSILSSLGQMIVGGGGLNMKRSIMQMRAADELRDLFKGDFGYKQGKLGMLSSLALAGVNIDLLASRKSGNILVGSDSLLNTLKLTDSTNITDNSSSDSSNGMSTSESGSATAGNSSSEDIKNTTVSDSQNDANNQMAEAKESEDNAVNIETVNENVVKIYTLLSDVADGNSSLLVRLSYDNQFTGLN